jgi:hypothetical protein
MREYLLIAPDDERVYRAESKLGLLLNLEAEGWCDASVKDRCVYWLGGPGRVPTDQRLGVTWGPDYTEEEMFRDMADYVVRYVCNARGWQLYKEVTP